MLFIYNKIFNQTALTINFTFAILVVMFMLYLFLLSCLCHISSCCHVYAIPLLVMFMPFFFLLSCLCHVPSHCHVYFISLLVMFIPYLFLLSCHSSSCYYVYVVSLPDTTFMRYLFHFQLSDTVCQAVKDIFIADKSGEVILEVRTNV